MHRVHETIIGWFRATGMTVEIDAIGNLIGRWETSFPLWQEALVAQGYPVFILPSGAGHDGVALSALTESAMLFVRCQGGISHNPAESVQETDMAAAIAVLEHFLLLTAQEVEV
jgi:acetylornithine deacetylase/succinyl-diaminopimelate desuccinylase-like protein